MFIERQQHPTIEWDKATGQPEPVLTHHLSDRAEPFKTVLPKLIEGAEKGEERVLVITSPLSEIIDETIRLHCNQDCGDEVVVDYKHWAYFEAVRSSLLRALQKVDQIKFDSVDDEDWE